MRSRPAPPCPRSTLPRAAPAPRRPALDPPSSLTPPRPTAGRSETGSLVSQPSQAYVSARIGQCSLSSVHTSIDALDSTCKVENLYAAHVMAPRGAPAEPPVLLLAGSDITVRNGSLCLPAHHMLVIEGASITLEDVKVTGEGAAADPKRSLPLVYVSHASVTLRGVSVCRNQMGHGVGVGAHGTLRLYDCELDANRTCGLVARGDTAAVRVHGTRFAHNGQDGATVSAGAAAEFQDCKFRQNTMLGLGVSGHGSSATATCCAAQRNGDHGFVAHRAARLSLNDCVSTGNTVGVLALGVGSSVQWSEGSVASCRQGMHVCEGASVRPPSRAVATSHRIVSQWVSAMHIVCAAMSRVVPTCRPRS